MAISDSVNALFLSILGRPADAATLAADVAAINAGTTLSQLAASLANSSEAAGDINTAFQAELGHGTDPASTAAAQAYLATGGSLAGERFFLAASQEGQSDIVAAYQSASGRAPTAAELNIQTYALANGSLAGLQASLVSEQAGIQAIYAAVLGRAPTASGLAAAEGAITGGQSVAAFTSQLVTSAINYVYLAELGRAATAAELSAAQGAVSAGGTIAALRGQLAMSAEAQADIGVIYQQVLGRAPSAADLAGSEQVLANGGALEAAAYNAPGTGLLTLASGSLALLPTTGSTVANANSVAGQLIIGSEAMGDIVAAFQNAAERAPSAVELAAAQSELNSGVTINQVRTEVDELAGGREPQYIGTVQITPQTVAGAPGLYAYSTLNDDAIVTANPALTDATAYGSATVTGFNAATDTLLIQARQDYPTIYPALGEPDDLRYSLPPPTQPVISGVSVVIGAAAAAVYTGGFGNSITLNGVPNLYPANIQVVPATSPSIVQAALITRAFQAATGHGPTAVELAAAESELKSGVGLANVQTEINQLAGSSAPANLFGLLHEGGRITPQLLSSSPTTYVYGLGDNDAIVSPNPGLLVDLEDSVYVYGFNPATDVVVQQASQIDASQSRGYVAGVFISGNELSPGTAPQGSYFGEGIGSAGDPLAPTPLPLAPDGSSGVTLVSASQIQLVGTSLGALTAANFQTVPVLGNQNIIGTYVAVLGRSPTAAEFAAAQAGITAGATLATLRGQLAISAEAQADVAALYRQILNRTPTASELTTAATQLSNGSALEAATAAASGVGAVPSLASGAVVQPQAGAGPGPVINSVAYLLATGSESVANISAEYVTNTGVAPNGVDVTAAISELVSGVPLVYQQLEAAELSGGAAPTFSGANSVITPQTIAGSTPRYVYSLGNDDAIVSPNATLGVELEAATHQGDSVVGFNPATDFLQFHGAQALQNGTSSTSPLVINGAGLSTPSGVGTTVTLNTGAPLLIYSVTPGQLSSANFVDIGVPHP